MRPPYGIAAASSSLRFAGDAAIALVSLTHMYCAYVPDRIPVRRTCGRRGETRHALPCLRDLPRQDDTEDRVARSLSPNAKRTRNRCHHRAKPKPSRPYASLTVTLVACTLTRISRGLGDGRGTLQHFGPFVGRAHGTGPDAVSTDYL